MRWLGLEFFDFYFPEEFGLNLSDEIRIDGSEKNVMRHLPIFKLQKKNKRN